MSIQKHCVYYRDDENKIYYYDNSNHRKYVNGTFYDKVTEELYYFDENGERHVIDIDVDGYALSADVDTRIENLSSWANETFLTDADLNDYALSADVDSRLEDTSAWANDTFVTSTDLEADKQYVMTNSGWQEIPKNTDIVADEYNPAAPPQTYGTDPGLEHYCIYDLKLYRCKEVCIGENDPWNPNYWEETTISEELYKNNMMNDNDIDNILNELD